MDVSEMNLKEKVDFLIDRELQYPDKKKKKKPVEFKLSIGMEKKAQRAAMKDKILVFLLKRTKTIVPVFAKIQDGMVVIGDKYYNASNEFFFLWKGKVPAMVIPEWDINPIGVLNYEEAVKNKRIIDPQTITLRAIKTAESMMPKPIGGKMWIWILLGAAAILYLMFGGG